MSARDEEGFAGSDGERGFQTAHWGRVVQAADAGTQEAEIALGRLHRTYSYPFYAYIRRQGHDAEVHEPLKTPGQVAEELRHLMAPLRD